MASGSLSISGVIQGLPSGTKTFAASIAAPAAVGVTLDLTLSAGDNTVAIPTGATAVLIVPGACATVPLVLKGASGDTGVALNRGKPTLLALDPTATSFIINVASSVSCVTELAFM
jgi:hypothetical protein